jgi:hypothetical protein
MAIITIDVTMEAPSLPPVVVHADIDDDKFLVSTQCPPDVDFAALGQAMAGLLEELADTLRTKPTASVSLD